MMDIFVYTTVIQTMTTLNANLDFNRKNTIEAFVVEEVKDVQYTRFCVDKVEYLRFVHEGQVVIVPHFRTNNSVVICNN